MIKVKSPVNIALIKYWGKKSTDPVRPSTPSLSVTLDAFYTETTVQESETFSFTLNHEVVKGESLLKVEQFVRLFQPSGPLKCAIESVNHVPTAAGIASSASGFSALSLALHHFYQKPLDQLVEYTAKGSGSAVRSLKGGAVIWHTDGTIESLDIPLERYQMAVVMIDTSVKKISSRAAMKSVQDSPHYKDWIKRNTNRVPFMKDALLNGDFSKIGTLMEESTLDMHSLGALANEPFVYLTNETVRLWEALIKARQNGLKAYATADAGPNLKILFETENAWAIQQFLADFDYPYVITRLSAQGATRW